MGEEMTARKISALQSTVCWQRQNEFSCLSSCNYRAMSDPTDLYSENGPTGKVWENSSW